MRVRAGGRNAITSIRTELVFRMQTDIGSDPQDLAHEGIQLLRKSMRRARRFSLGAVPHGNVKISVVVLSSLDERIKNQIGHGVIAIKSRAQEFSRGSFKRVIANVGIRPFDQHGFKMYRPRRGIYCGSDLVSSQVES